MARNYVLGAGTKGIVRDQKPAQLEPAYWSNGRNVRVRGDRVESMGGVLTLAMEGIYGEALKPISGAIFSDVTDWNGFVQDYFVFSTGKAVYVTYGQGNRFARKLSSASVEYQETLDNLFQYVEYNGLLVLNNGVDAPQIWLQYTEGSGASLTVYDGVDTLQGWDASWRVKQVVKYKNFLFALGMKEGQYNYPHKMRWSDAADPGMISSNWDDGDPTTLAGSFAFPDTENGGLQAGLELGDNLYVYKDRAIWQVSFVGGVQVFNTVQAIGQVGTDMPRSLVRTPSEFQGRAHHFFAGLDSFYMFDGAQVTPMFEMVFRREFEALRNEEVYKTRSFSVVNASQQEIWFCFPEKGAEVATLALVLDYRYGTHSIRELNGSSTIVSGKNISASLYLENPDIPYFEDDVMFEEDDVGFLNRLSWPGSNMLIEMCPGDSDVYVLEQGKLWYDGGVMSAYVERVQIPAMKYDSRDPEAYMVDYHARKLVTEVTPRVFAGEMKIEVGVSELENAAVTWTTPVVYDGTQYNFDLAVPVSGRFVSFRFSSSGEEDFSFAGYDYDVTVGGEY